MFLSQFRSFQAKLLVLVMLSSVLSAVLVGSVLLAREYSGARSTTINQLATTARTHAYNLDAAVQMNYPHEAADMLASLAEVENLGAARVYDAEGRPFVEYRRPEDPVEMPGAAPQGDYTEGDWYFVVEPILHESERVGTLAIAYDMNAIVARRRASAALTVLLALIAAGVALGIALRLQRTVTGPIRELLGTARRVSHSQDYSVRARKYEDDELGQFTDVFNEMLSQIDRHSETVRQANERFRTAVEASPNGMVMIDEQGKIVLVNAQTEQLFGYGRDELIGRSVELLIPQRLHEYAHFHEVFLENPQARSMGAGRELFGLRKDGSEFPVEIGLNPIATEQGLRVLASVVDITQRRAAESAVRESEERLRTLMNAIPAIIWTADADGAATSFNNQWFEYTGLSAAESLSGLRRRIQATPPNGEPNIEANPLTRGWMRAVHDDDREVSAGRWQSSVEQGVDFECELRLRRHDGAYRWFLIRALPLRDERNTITGWFGTTTDIEDRKLAEQERDELLASERAARSEAERASKAKDEFVATLSHELRTPMTAILGWAQMLRSGNLPADQQEQGYDIILRNARVQTQLIEDLLDMSRIMSGKIRLEVRSVELPTVVDAAIETVQPGAQAKEIRLETNIDRNIAPIRGDADRLQQVIWNLLSNAIKFTPRGGRVAVSLQQVESHIEIIVHDTGEGISEEFLPHIFERFRQADPSTTRRHGGLGLGLAIAKQLIELHGGSITADSEGEGQGTTFTIRLPVSVVRATADDDLLDEEFTRGAGKRITRTRQRGLMAQRDRSSLTGVRVLIVEDEPDARQLISSVLSAQGASVESAASGLEGLDRLGTFRPDVVVSDIGMPEMDGYEFIRSLRSRPREEGGRAPAVALTAFARTEDRTRSLLAGYQLHVSKPVDPAELIASVASLASMAESYDRDRLE